MDIFNLKNGETKEQIIINNSNEKNPLYGVALGISIVISCLASICLIDLLLRIDVIKKLDENYLFHGAVVHSAYIIFIIIIMKFILNKIFKMRFNGTRY